MANRFVLNNISYHGSGAINEIPGEITRRGFKKAFVCSDPDLVKFGVTAKVTDLLDAAGIPWSLYSEIKPNPTIKNVQDGVEAFKASGADVIVQFRRVRLEALVARPGRVELRDTAVLGAPRHPSAAFGINAARNVQMLVGLCVGNGAVVDRVGVDGGPELREVVGAVFFLRAAEGAEEARHDHSPKNADDRNHDKQFNQGEAPFLLHCRIGVQDGRMKNVSAQRAFAVTARVR